MRILLLAPHPFYQERGTPIAVDMLLSSLSEQGHQVDVVTFNEGESRGYSNVKLFRINPMPMLTGLKPGFSIKKIYLDVWLFFKAFSLLRKNKYDIVHAVEESGFMAAYFKYRFKTPFVLDMDSLMATQLVDKFKFLKPMEKILRRVEAYPIKRASVVVPVCQAIADEAVKYNQDNVFLLKDVSLARSTNEPVSVESIRDVYGISSPIFMYIGNLESYQGIDLMLDSMKGYITKGEGHLVIIGGSDSDIQRYKQRVKDLAIADSVSIIGRKPVSEISAYMKQADVLMSPRVQGENTPMKIYSYLDSGVPVLATDLPTHTQVISSDIGMLCNPEAAEMAQAMHELIASKEYRSALSERASAFIKEEHSLDAYQRQLKLIYSRVSELNV